MIRIGVAGHRWVTADATAFASAQCSAILHRARAEWRDVRALSAIAEGADAFFADAAVALGIRLEIVRPFDDYASDFTTREARERYERLRAAARAETRLAYPHRSTEAYLAGMRWIVDNSDVLVAIWDGRAAPGAGGTADAVDRANRAGRPWIHVNVVNGLVSRHGPRDATPGADAIARLVDSHPPRPEQCPEQCPER
jgi:hypothetical protein